MRIASLFLILFLAAGCTSTGAGSDGGGTSHVSEASSPTVPADGGTRTDAASTLIPNTVCHGEPSDCPANPPAAGAACTGQLLCCNYILGEDDLRGCTCDQGHWSCANLPCGCLGGP